MKFIKRYFQNRAMHKTARDALAHFCNISGERITTKMREFYSNYEVAYSNPRMQALSRAQERLKYALSTAKTDQNLTRSKISNMLFDSMTALDKVTEFYHAFTSQPVPEEDKKLLLTKMIERLKSAKVEHTFDMRVFRGGVGYNSPGLVDPYTKSETVIEMHACGTVACLSGHLRLLPEFSDMYDIDEKQFAAVIFIEGILKYIELSPAETVAYVFGIPIWFADMMIQDRHCPHAIGQHVLYRKDFRQVKPADVVEILEMLLEGVSPKDILTRQAAKASN